MDFKDFWNGLNDGDIFWDFICNLICNEERPIEERKEAVGALVQRGFVVAIPVDAAQPYQKYVSVFKDRARNTINNLNPVFEDKRLYFTRCKYAEEYRQYLLSLPAYEFANLETYPFSDQ